MIKRILKNILGFSRSKLHKINSEKGVYIGKNVHVVNGKNIKIGSNVSVRANTDLFADDYINIGKNTDIGERNRLTGNINIGNSVLFGPNNYISSRDHCYKDILKAIMDQGAYTPHKDEHDDLVIGEGSWIGTHVAIIGAVHIGKHCVIGANSVVTKDIPDYSVVVGSPARIIKKYDFKRENWVSVNIE